MKKSKIYNHTVPNEFLGEVRLREYLPGIFPFLETGSAVKKAIRKKQIRINGTVGSTGDWVSAGFVISFEWFYTINKKENKIDILFEDDYLLVVRKPPGISSSGNSRSFQMMLQSISLKDEDGFFPFPFLVHRLDKATEGLMIAAKNISTRRLLAEMLERHEIIKKYVLIAVGRIPKSILFIDNSIDDKKAKTEILKSIPLNTKDPTSMVFAKLHSGRTHQLRKHFSFINHPIVGDQLYNKDGLSFGTGLLLCAYSLEFVHPITKETIIVEYPIPHKISKYKALDLG